MVTMPHWPLPPWSRFEKNNLENFQKLMHFFENPEDKLPPIIHVAGTNGKGSSVAFVKAIFEEAGYCVQTYTSPHLIEFNERIYCNKNFISDEDVYIFAEKVRLVCEKMDLKLTFFEAITAMAFLYFASKKSDILLLEVGIGGKLDVTNVIKNPLVSLITPISYDHMEFLGDTLPLIASQKAGIIKYSCDSIISLQEEEVYEIFHQKASQMKSNCFFFSYDFGVIKSEEDDKIYYKDKDSEIFLENISLKGDHQYINASAVIAAIKLTKIQQYFQITDEHIKKGLSSTYWLGRIDHVNKQRFPILQNITSEIWLDGAHNTGGALVLSNWVKENIKGSLYLIIGMTKKKEIESFVQYFVDIVDNFIAVAVHSEASSYSSEHVSKKISAISSKEVINFDSLDEAFDVITKMKKQPDNILISGSLFLISDFYKYVKTTEKKIQK